MNQKWQDEIEIWCSEIKQLDDEMKMELLTEGLTEKWERMSNVKQEKMNKIALTIYTDWLTRQ